MPSFGSLAPAVALVFAITVEAGDILLNAGGPALPNGFRCDTGEYSNGGLKYTGPVPNEVSSGWTEAYQTHGYPGSPTGDLEYKIPVPDGNYTVNLFWGETTANAAGIRLLTVKINGELQSAPEMPDGILDVFKAAGGKNKPYIFNAMKKKPVGGFMTFTFGRVAASKENPMVSGIVILGENADGKLGKEDIGGNEPVDGGIPEVPPSSGTPGEGTSSPPAACGTLPSVTGKVGDNFYMNVGSGSVARINFGGDNINYIVESNTGFAFKAPVPVVDMGSWPEPQQSHRYTEGESLTYRVPVSGTGPFEIGLQLTESFHKKAGDRVMDVVVNGKVMTKNLDVFEEKGFNKPHYKSYSGIQPMDGFIFIQMKRVTNNPFLNGLVISGSGASTKAVGGPDAGPLTKKCFNGPSPPANTPPTSPPEKTAPVTPSPPTGPPLCAAMNTPETDFSGGHTAHAVSQGPYVQTDFDKDGSAIVSLDGTLSHSHFQDGTKIGKIVFWEWTWKDPKNPDADATGKVVKQGKKVNARFPEGMADLKLRVVDQFCNAAVDMTTVMVYSATMPGAYCYLYDYGATTPVAVPLPLSAKADPKPQKGQNVGSIDFKNTAAFGKFPFSASTFAVRCQYYVDVKKSAGIEYKLIHSGPVKLFHDGNLVGSSVSRAANQMMKTTKKQYKAGLNMWEIQYLKLKAFEAKLIFQFGSGAIIPPDTVRHDSGSTIPVIMSLSKTNGPVDTLLLVLGTSFMNGVKVKFGTVTADIIEGDAGMAQVRAPPGKGTVQVTVTTGAGVSNSVPFTYTAPTASVPGVNPTFPLKMVQDTIKTPAGGALNMKHIAAIVFGPDGRLYCGSTVGSLHVLTLDKQLAVTKQFNKNVKEEWQRAVLGLAFNPAHPGLVLYFATSTLFWKKKGIIKSDVIGWKNGKIRSVSMSSAVGGFNNDVKDVVTGLPVSNHDHSVQALEFLPNGKMLVSIGGFTNGGISIPTDSLGGFPASPLSGAIVECPHNGVTNVQYSTALPGSDTKMVGGGCKVYAGGLRNSFGTTLHTNGGVYATDNGPNPTYGKFSTDCDGGMKGDKSIPDKLFLLQPGKCHGHPNLNRGINGNPAECVFASDACVKPLLSNLQSSTNGVCEYRSNIFGAEVQGNLFLSKYAPLGGNEGRVSRVMLNGNQVAKNGLTNEFWKASGLGISEGSRGELIMCRVQRDGFIVLKPEYAIPKTTMFISVMPRKGPAAGGIRVTVTGHNFGLSPSATFGGNACTNVASIDDDTFKCTLPAGGKNKQVKVSVKGKTGTVSGIGTDFWYF